MTSYPCPFCHAPANLRSGCSGCGRQPDPDAADVIRLDAEIPALAARVAQARSALGAAEAALYDARRRRDAAVARVRAARLTAHAPVSVGPAPASGAPAPAGAQVRIEASTRTVQNVLFMLGGLLLATAAIVFTAVAWATFGVAGRAALLATFTGLALAVPLVALRRGLTATAETFAAVGLLLLLLDGYAIWYVGLFGLGDGPAGEYAGLVCALTALIALGYGAGTGLAGPRFAALLAAQPVLPLLLPSLFPLTLDLTGTAVLLSTVGALDLAVLRWLRTRTAVVDVALRALAWTAFAVAGLGAALLAFAAVLVAETAGPTAGAGAALVAAAVLVVVAAMVARVAAFQAAAGAVLVVAVGVAAARFATAVGASAAPVLVAGVAAALALVVAGTARRLPPAVRPGPWVGALAVLSLPALYAVVAALRGAAATVAAAQPAFAADLVGLRVDRDGWQVPVMLAALTMGLAALLPRVIRGHAVLGGAVLIVLAVPAAFPLAWWSVPVLDLAVVAVLAGLALGTRSAPAALLRAAAAALLAGHAALAGLGRPGSTAAVLFTLVVIGVATAAGALGSAARAGGPAAHRRLIGGLALTAGLLAWPGALAAGLAAVRVEPWWVARSSVGAVAVLLPVLVAVDRRWPVYRAYAFAAVLGGAVPLPVWAVLGGMAEPAAVYAAASLLAIGLTTRVMPSATGAAQARPAEAEPPTPAPSGTAPSRGGSFGERPSVLAVARTAAALPALWLAVVVAPDLWAVLGAPYGWLDGGWLGGGWLGGGWLGGGWTGRPDGVGLAPGQVSPPELPNAVALGLLAVAVAVAVAGRLGLRISLWCAAAVAAPGGVVTLAALGARWPAVPAASLLCGLGALLAAAFAGHQLVRLVTTVAGVLLAGAGLAGALATRPATLSALGLTVAAATAAGAAGRWVAARLAGWLAAVVAGVAFAVTAGLAADLPLHRAAFGVLAVAAAALVLGTALAGRRPVEATAVQAAAHGTAGLALLLALAAPRHAAVLCTLWGVALGLRALWPHGSPDSRRVLVVAAAGAELLGWWLLMSAGQVALVEAYTVPAAAVALLAGWLALRGRPDLSSWAVYGPALAAAFLPSLASVLVSDGQPVRRLLLGVAAIAVVLVGAAARRQAPVLVAGGVLALVALHELLLVWDLLPRWIPLAGGGLLLVGLAMTLERRRRDLARVRAAVTRMT